MNLLMGAAPPITRVKINKHPMRCGSNDEQQRLSEISPRCFSPASSRQSTTARSTRPVACDVRMIAELLAAQPALQHFRCPPLRQWM